MKKHLRTAWALMMAVTLVGVLAVLTDAPRPVSATPNFARQYNMACSSCHTIIPRLNRTGWEFRRAGYRNPSEIGLTRDFEKGRSGPGFVDANYFCARLTQSLTYSSMNYAASKSGGYNADSTSRSYAITRIPFPSVSLYPLSGGFLGNWGSFVEVSAGASGVSLGNALLRVACGDADMFWEGRVGIFHALEGYGASDAGLALSQPLFRSTSSVNVAGKSNPWRLGSNSGAGLEGGFTYKATSLTATVFNGTVENGAGGFVKAAGSPTENDKDIQLFFNQFINVDGNDLGLSAAYYMGYVSLTGDSSKLFRNNFNRAAFFLSVPISKVVVMGGYAMGRDDWSPQLDSSAKDAGFFAEADMYANENLGFGVRYDAFDPSDKIDKNSISAIAGFVSVPLNNGLQFQGEVRDQMNEKGLKADGTTANPKQSTLSVTVRTQYIW